MPRLPTIELNQNVGAQIEREGSLTPDQSGRALRQAGQSIGGSIGQAGRALTGLAEQMEVSSLSAKMSAIEARHAERILQSQNTALDVDADGVVTPESMEKIRSIQTDLNGKLDGELAELSAFTPGANEYLGRNRARMASSFSQRSAEVQSRMLGDVTKTNYSAMLSKNGAVLRSNPDLFDSKLQGHNEYIQALSKNEEIPAAAIRGLDLQGKQELAMSAVRGDGAISPEQTLDALNKGEWDKYLDGPSKNRLINEMEADIRARKAKVENLGILKYKKPYKYLEKVGDMGGISPVSFGDREGFESIVERGKWRDEKNQKHGIELPFLMEEEVLALRQSFLQRNPDNQVQFLEGMSSSMPREYYSEISQELFKKEPAVGVAMVIAPEDGAVAKELVQGHKLISEKAIKLPPRNIFLEAFNSQTGQSIQDPNLRSNTVDAVMAIYAQESDRIGEASSDLDEDRMGDAIKKIIGEPVDINDKKTLSFRSSRDGDPNQGKFLDSDEFEELWDDVSVNDIRSVQDDVPRIANGSEVNLDKTKRRADLVAVGDGIYVMRVDTQFLVDKSGKPFELNLKEIHRRKAIKGFAIPTPTNTPTSQARARGAGF